MSNLHLVTGHAGKTHVTSADHGSLYAALFGSGTYLLDKGSKFAASIISDNLVRIADGDLLMQGRHCRIPDNEYVELVISSGTQGYKRSDLIVARYTKDADTGVEEADLVVLIGEPIAASPQDPAYITGDIIKGGALTNDVPLYRVNLDGTTITGVDSLLPEVLPGVSTLPGRIDDVYNELLGKVNGIGNVRITKAGTYTGTGTVGWSGSGSNVKLAIVLPYLVDYVVIMKENTADGVERMIVDVGKLTASLQDYVSIYDTGSARDQDACKWSISGLTIYRYGDGVTETMNTSGKVYRIYYIDIL